MLANSLHFMLANFMYDLPYGSVSMAKPWHIACTWHLDRILIAVYLDAHFSLSTEPSSFVSSSISSPFSFLLRIPPISGQIVYSSTIIRITVFCRWVGQVFYSGTIILIAVFCICTCSLWHTMPLPQVP